MGWVYLAVAIGLEVAGTSAMKLSDGLTRLLPSLLIFLLYGLSFAALSLSLGRGVQLSVAYAIWSGVGTAAIAVISNLWFDEPLGALKVAALALIVAGVVLLNLTGAEEAV